MLAAGDELGRGQSGNNNGYAQDTPLAWMDWAAADQALADFAARLIKARRSCAALTDLSHLTGAPLDATLQPDVVWRRPDGAAMGIADWNNPDHRTLIADLYRPGMDGAPASRALVVLHAGWSGFRLSLPVPGEGKAWRCMIDSAAPTAEAIPVETAVDVEPRTALLFVEETSLAAPSVATTGAIAVSAVDTSAQLARLAEAAGLAQTWWDIAGTNHRVPDDTKRALLRAMKLPAENASAIAASLQGLTARTVFAPLPASLVVTEGSPVTLRLGPAFASLPRAVALILLRQDGSRERWVVTPQSGTLSQITAPDGRSAAVRTITLPAQPLGQHQIICEDGAEIVTCRLIVAPQRCYLPPELANGARRFGLAAHLYTLRRSGDQGIGDFSTLAAVGEHTAAAGGAVIGLNPLHALFPENRNLVSPYSPSDRRFLDPIFIDVAAIPFLSDLPEIRAALAAEEAAFVTVRATAAVDYPAVWAAKSRVLAVAAARLATLPPEHPAAAAFTAFLAQGGRSLERFATFEALSAAYPQGSWHDWPMELRDPNSAGVSTFAGHAAEALRFACFMQWVADHQLAAADARSRRAGLSLGFYRDLAVGTAPVGAEAWSEQELLMTGISVGAPPDPFSIEGQNWQLPPPNPVAMAADGYAGFGELLRANMRHAGALRIDHVLGLNRLFLIPEGGRAADGAYLAYPLHDLLGVTALESQRAQCMVVGEDLGTVPDGVREAMAARGLLSYKVFWFERQGEGFRPPASYPPLAAACVSTHDLPTLAGWWIGADIAERVALGLSDEATAVTAREARRREKTIAVAALAAQGLIPAAETHDLSAPMPVELAAAFHAFIGATPCVLDLVQADDLAGETVAVNLPGTDTERPNWRRKVEIDAEALWATTLGQAILRALRERLSASA